MAMTVAMATDTSDTTQRLASPFAKLQGSTEELIAWLDWFADGLGRHC